MRLVDAMTASGRRRGLIGAISALAGIAAGVLGGWLAGHWLWGVACAFLVLLAVAAAAEGLKSRSEDAPGPRIVFVPGHGAISKSIFVAGDVTHSRTVKIGGGATGAVVVLVALGIAFGGTVYFTSQPSGYPSVAAGRSVTSWLPTPPIRLKPFGAAYSRWQLAVPGSGYSTADVLFTDGMLLVSVPAHSGAQVTAYHEATGERAWSSIMPSTPELTGNLLFVLNYPNVLTSYSASTLGPTSVSRINPVTGNVLWTSQRLPNTQARGLTASGRYVVLGPMVLSAATGATLMVLPRLTWACAVRRGILIQVGSHLTLDSLLGGRLQTAWSTDITGYEVFGTCPQIMLVREAKKYQDFMTYTGKAVQSRATVALVNPRTGAIGTKAAAVWASVTTRGIDLISPDGRLAFLSSSGEQFGRSNSEPFQYEGGILWSFSSRSRGIHSVVIQAMMPDSFEPLGKIVITRWQMAEASGQSGDQAGFATDGRYTAVGAGGTIFVFKLQ
jgi:hypothetical protein